MDQCCRAETSSAGIWYLSADIIRRSYASPSNIHRKNSPPKYLKIAHPVSISWALSQVWNAAALNQYLFSPTFHLVHTGSAISKSPSYRNLIFPGSEEHADPLAPIWTLRISFLWDGHKASLPYAASSIHRNYWFVPLGLSFWGTFVAMWLTL